MGETEKQQGGPPGRGDPPCRERSCIRQALVFYGVGLGFVAMLAMLWMAADVLLLIFASLLLAVLLHDASLRVQGWLKISRRLALALVVVLLLSFIGVGGWLLLPGVVQQSVQLLDTIPQAILRLQEATQRYRLLQYLAGQLPTVGSINEYLASMVSRAGVFFSGVLGAVANIAILAVVSLYFAACPAEYLNGILHLVPPQKRRRARQILDEIGSTLADWLMGKLLSMVLIGILSALGLALLGVPLALVLGILAGLLDFIPYIGPIMAGVPAVLIAFAESPLLAFYVVLLFIALQFAEGYLILPLIERRTVSLPPAVTISMQMILGAFFGLAGVALATPLTAVLAVLITTLYVQDELGEG